MLYHISESPDISRFEPRLLPTADRPVVWAVSDDRLHNYLLPRDCPRVTFFAGERTTAEDCERFLGSATSVVAFESNWLERVRQTRLYCYALPPESFTCVDACAGYWQSERALIPAGVQLIDDCLGMLAGRGVEIRIVPTLWPLHDQVIASTLSYSIIRMRNATPRIMKQVT